MLIPIYQNCIIFDENFGKMSIGSRVRKYRDNKWLSQSDLATKAEVSQSAISSLESDKSIPNSVMLHRIAKELGVDINALLEDEGTVSYKNNQIVFNQGALANMAGTILANQAKISSLIAEQNRLIELMFLPEASKFAKDSQSQ